MRVLLAGGAGYIGDHTAVALIAAGHEVVLLDDLSGSHAVAAERVTTITGAPAPLVAGDAADEAAVSAVFDEHGPIDAIIHLAALKAVGESTQKPLEYYPNNLDTTFAFLRVGIARGIRSFVFSSTGTVYSDPADLPFTEESTTSIDLSNAYSKSKRMNEVVLADVARVNPELNVTVLRYFNPVGAHSSGLIGEDPAGIPNNLMFYVSRVAIGSLDEVGIFGSDYDTPTDKPAWELETVTTLYNNPADHEQLVLLISRGRKTSGLTQQKLAERAGVSIGTIRKLCTGATPEPGFFVVQRVMRAILEAAGRKDPSAAQRLREEYLGLACGEPV